jgi:hypothetical protein
MTITNINKMLERLAENPARENMPDFDNYYTLNTVLFISRILQDGCMKRTV